MADRSAGDLVMTTGRSREPFFRVAESILTAQAGAGRLDGHDVGRVINGAEAAYLVQRLVAARAAASALGQVAGYKVGMSSRLIQGNFGLTEPVYGHVFGSRLFESGAALSVQRSRRLGVECEIAATLAGDLGPEGAPYDAAGIAGRVQSLHAAIEVIENRFANLEETPVWALAADNMIGFGGVISAGATVVEPLASRGGRILVDGEVRETGRSGDLAYGGPMGCLAWLANQLSRVGAGLRAGQVVFCGGITAPYWLEPPSDRDASEITADVTGFESARLTINWE